MGVARYSSAGTWYRAAVARCRGAGSRYQYAVAWFREVVAR